MIRPGSNKATNNTLQYANTKIALRYDCIKENNDLTILECFAGEQLIWKSIEKRINKKTNRTTIDANKKFNADFNINALTFLKNNDLNKYDIIDLDSWGSPIKYLDILFKKKYKGIVILTYCSPVLMNPDKILCSNFYKEIYSDCNKKVLLNKDIGVMFKQYLFDNNIHEFKGLISKNRVYCSIILK